MLILNRRVEQSIVIGDPALPIAVIKVIEIGKGNVRLGIKSDRSIAVNRDEIAEDILREREQDNS